MSMTLAKVEDEGGDTSDKLSMFYLETRDDQGQLNNIQATHKSYWTNKTQSDDEIALEFQKVEKLIYSFLT